MTKVLILGDSKSVAIVPNRKTEFSAHLLMVLQSKVIKSKNISVQEKLKVLPLGKQTLAFSLQQTLKVIDN